jgi:hypothetical protein
MTSLDASETIEIIDPCLNPFSLTPTAQTDPADYPYSSASYPTVEVTLAQYVVDPSVCPITYSCSNTGPKTDMCSIDGVSNFDTTTGDYDFATIDKATYPSGSYTFTITGTVGEKVVTETF